MAEGVIQEAKRRVSVEDLAGREVKLRAGAKERRGPCPLCGAGAGSSSVFRVRLAQQDWTCFACGAFGDVVDLEQALRGGSALEAANRLVGGTWSASPAESRFKPKPEPTGPSNSEKIAAELWAEAKPIKGTLGVRYLLARGIAPEVVELASARLRFHPFAKWGWDGEARTWIKAPAILLQVETVAGPTGGVHCTYLARDGRSKAALSPAKRMWGPQRDAEGRPGGAWLIGPDAGEATALVRKPLVVAEGMETALSVATLFWRGGHAVRAVAALALNRLQGGEAMDADRCVDPYRAVADEAQPPFLWPTPPDEAAWAEVVIAVDRDMSPVKVRGRTPRGRVCEFERDREARARICAALAEAAWRRAGVSRVRAIQPSPGCDFNDELRRVLADEKRQQKTTVGEAA